MGEESKTHPFCVACGDVPAAMHCPQCGDDPFCGLCYKYMHAHGTRAQHTPVLYPGVDMHAHTQPCRGTVSEGDAELEEQKKLIEAAKKSPDARKKVLRELLGAGETDKSDSMDESSSGSKECGGDMGDDDEKKDETGTLGSAGGSKSSGDSDDDYGKRRGGEWIVDSYLYCRRERDMEESSSGECDLLVDLKDLPGDRLDASKRARCIPMRLTAEERSLLQVLEGVLEVSEYTDKVDVSGDMYGFRSKYNLSDIIDEEIRDILRLVCGVSYVGDYEEARKLLKKTLDENEAFFQRVFEAGRRYKVMNPASMRTSYGKLIHFLQDYIEGNGDEMRSPWRKAQPILTVYSFLKARGGSAALSLLEEEALEVATHVLSSTDTQKVDSAQMAKLKTAKTEARKSLMSKYATSATGMTDSDVERVIDSLDDARCFLKASREPVDRMIELLEKYFSPEEPSKRLMEDTDRKASLEIRAGQGTAKFSHSHSTQFTFVWQTLHLWREVQNESYLLWLAADQDLLEAQHRYRLANTGQGFNRMQAAPTVRCYMSNILSKVQRAARDRWVGLSVIHISDQDVPNALFFIDKYSQVPRILGPLVSAIERLDILSEDPRSKDLITACGGAEKCKLHILNDFFRHGFDGSGSDGGSCIDGRLTSAWNWCSLIEKKSYYPLLLATGFMGFDGKFK